ncbi:pentatricopeptide repeat-containing protein At1g06710, mitochondrial isoform X1 [Brassica napus]|uniref:pentatricopeptide repeat-containing protein At1g06710, mitochondrial isoform X1 n=1 Tax=Brassica napus TaxID=3708 RepID=UPI0020795DBC|nr:pentatricopeptide repeat-containing protein At1g06710, mitochondrial isoform X1 [Brassica napus]XP_048613791.1 pentatricopeptide repeat-containing protein At1g06710, mitochondrial isoform X1 [Brassica napus]
MIVRCILSRSHHLLIQFSTTSSLNRSLLDTVSTCSRYLTSRFISTPPPDEMYGFDEPFSPNEPLEVVGFTKDYTFLLDSLADSRKTTTESPPSIDAIAIADTISNSEDVFGSKSQKLLRQFREKLTESLVIEALRLVEKPSAVISFFIWAGRQIGYKHTPPVYNALVDLIVTDNDEKVPEELLQQIREDDKETLGEFLNVLIRRRCRNGSFSVALEELGRLKDFSFRPSRSTYNCLVQAFLKAGSLDSASLIHREMSVANVSIDGFTLRCFAYSLCKAGKWREALALVEAERFVPDAVFYTKLISGLCEASLFEEAMEFLNRMRADSCLPNVVTYSTLLCGCLNKKQLGRCKRVLSMMMIEGCYPSPKVFNSLVHAYCTTGDHSYAYKLFKKMVQCGHTPGYVVYNILIGSICGGGEDSLSSDLLVLAEKAYTEMLAAGVVLNKINVSRFTRCLCNAGKYEKAFSVIREMIGKGFVPDNSTYSKVLGYLCNASKMEMAFLLFEEMKTRGLVADVYTYTIMVDSFCKAGLIEQGRKWFDEMRNVGCKPNVVTYTALIHAYLKANKVGYANELFEVMISEGCVPNVVTYSALIDGHCKAGQTEKACRIFERMCGSKDVPDVDMYFTEQHDGERPNVVTYGALVDGFCKSHRVEEARKLLDAMSMEGCEPNEIVYDALIDGLCKVGKLEEAQEVKTEMSEHGFTATIYTYSSLIDRYFKMKRQDLVSKVLSKMLDSCKPNVVIYTEMIDGLCKVGKTDEAYKLMKVMEENGCQPNVVTYTALIDGFGVIGKIETCLELLERMGSKGVAPNYVTYRVLIGHCCQHGVLDVAYKLLEEMKQTHWPTHASGYRKVIEGFSKEFIESLGLLDEIAKDDTAPFVSVYRLLIDNLIKGERLEMALTLLEEVATLSVTLGNYSSTYNMLIESLCVADKVDKAFQLFSEMTKKGVSPDMETFCSLIKGLFRKRKISEALLLLDFVSHMVLYSFSLLNLKSVVIVSSSFFLCNVHSSLYCLCIFLLHCNADW